MNKLGQLELIAGHTYLILVTEERHYDFDRSKKWYEVEKMV